jgi:hypothetical protein
MRSIDFTGWRWQNGGARDVLPDVDDNRRDVVAAAA